MTEAEAAYEAAEKAIDETLQLLGNVLKLDDKSFLALDRLPPEIAMLSWLNELSLCDTQVSDLGPIAGLTGLTSLQLRGTKVSDISPLTELRRLRSLSLGGTPVINFGPISAMTELIDLYLSNTSFSDLGLLTKLTKLETLGLENTFVAKLGPITGLTNLNDLWIENVPATDLQPLLGLKRLASEPGYYGLTLTDCGATLLDPRISEIAGIEDKAERARTLFAYLETKPKEPFLFLSYSNQDRSRVNAYHDLLTLQNLPVWWDQDIFAGDKWRQEIADRLNGASAVVTFWTESSVQSDPVIEEASKAQKAGKLVPVRLDDAALPYGFSETQFIDMRDWDGTVVHPKMQKLLQALRDKLHPPSQAEMMARLAAASPVAMVAKGGVLSPIDTPPHVRPEVENAPDLDARLEGLRQQTKFLRNMAEDRDSYQLPNGLRHALAGVTDALTANTLSWYGIDAARATLCDCMEEHDAAASWNVQMARGAARLVASMADLRPLLQPRQVPADQPGAKPPEPDPIVRTGEVPVVVTLAKDVQDAVSAAPETLEPAVAQLVQSEVDKIEIASQSPDSSRKFHQLRRAVRGLTYLTGSIIVGVSVGVSTNLLTAPEAAQTLATRLKPLLEKLVQFFL